MQTFTITLKPEEWNVVLGALSEAPYRLAAPIIQSLHEQAKEQGAQPGPQESAGSQPLPMRNGHDGDHDRLMNGA